MSNKKVYLAKNTLASGFDVEYVKSHLSRIPGIIIVEANSSVKPEECAAFVIVPDKDLIADFDGEILLSKNVHQDLVDFLENHSSSDPEEFIFIASNKQNTDEPGDVEETFPMSFYLESDFEEGLKKKGHYDKFGYIIVEEGNETELLVAITDIIEEPYGSWVEVKRHHSPKPDYAVPPVPSLEQRIVKVQANTPEISADRHHYFNDTSRMKLLLLRRN